MKVLGSGRFNGSRWKDRRPSSTLANRLTLFSFLHSFQEFNSSFYLPPLERNALTYIHWFNFHPQFIFVGVVDGIIISSGLSGRLNEIRCWWKHVGQISKINLQLAGAQWNYHIMWRWRSQIPSNRRCRWLFGSQRRGESMHLSRADQNHFQCRFSYVHWTWNGMSWQTNDPSNYPAMTLHHVQCNHVIDENRYKFAKWATSEPYYEILHLPSTLLVQSAAARAEGKKRKEMMLMGINMVHFSAILWRI